MHLHLVSFHGTICFWKKLSLREMLIEQIIEVESRGSGLLVVHIPKTGYFHDKKKLSKANLRVMLKMLQKAIYLDFSDQAKSQNWTPKCKIINVFLTWPEVKGGICWIGFQISKILLIQMALKTCEMWSKWHLNGHFFQKLTKNRPAAGCFAPRLP